LVQVWQTILLTFKMQAWRHAGTPASVPSLVIPCCPADDTRLGSWIIDHVAHGSRHRSANTSNESERHNYQCFREIFVVHPLTFPCPTLRYHFHQMSIAFALSSSSVEIGIAKLMFSMVTAIHRGKTPNTTAASSQRQWIGSTNARG
jgi:hypothetical protein